MRTRSEGAKNESPVIRGYARLAPQYDNRWSQYVEASVCETIRRLEFNSTEKLLDVGCGTGSLLRHISLSFPDAVLCGLDPSAEMLAIARQKLDPHIELREGWAESLPFCDDSFDIVVSCSSFHYWRKPEIGLREVARVLKADGRIVITDWCNDYLACQILDVYLRIFDHAHFKAYGTKQLHRLLKAEFRDIKLERYKIDWMCRLMTATAQPHVA